MTNVMEATMPWKPPSLYNSINAGIGGSFIYPNIYLTETTQVIDNGQQKEQ